MQNHLPPTNEKGAILGLPFEGVSVPLRPSSKCIWGFVLLQVSMEPKHHPTEKENISTSKPR